MYQEHPLSNQLYSRARNCSPRFEGTLLSLRTSLAYNTFRFLQPTNLLLKSHDDMTNVKVADFGLSKIVGSNDQQVLQTACGTPIYVAPEVLLGEGYGGEVDLW